MNASPDDWRRTGQEAYLRGLSFTWKNHQAYSVDWEHDHCEFCWAKFLDPNYADWMREALASGTDDAVAAGYTNVTSDAARGGRYWVCESCVTDFRREFEWSVVDSDPEAWPYDTPEPQPRPTAADSTPQAE